MGYGGKEALLTLTGKPGDAGLDGIIRQDALGLARELTTRGFPLQQQGVLKLEGGTRPLQFEEGLAIAEIFERLSGDDARRVRQPFR
jgi:hypothetical protein